MIEFARENKNVCIKPLSVTLHITLSSRLLLMLFPERARRITWVVAQPLPGGPLSEKARCLCRTWKRMNVSHI
jgi:hypothetical protein